MKTWITTFAIAALTLCASTSITEARPHHRSQGSSHIYVSGYRSCGTPIYTERILVGYDRCGYPVWRYRAVEAPRHYYQPERRPRYRSAPVCPPPRPSYGGYRNGGIIIQGSFRL